MFEELKRKEEIGELKTLLIELGSKIHNIGAKLDDLSKSLKRTETTPRMAQKQPKTDISQ